MIPADGWRWIPCPCPMDERQGECEGSVYVWMDGQGEGGVNTWRAANGDIRPCPACGYGTNDAEINCCMDRANRNEADHD